MTFHRISGIAFWAIALVVVLVGGEPMIPIALTCFVVGTIHSVGFSIVRAINGRQPW